MINSESAWRSVTDLSILIDKEQSRSSGTLRENKCCPIGINYRAGCLVSDKHNHVGFICVVRGISIDSAS